MRRVSSDELFSNVSFRAGSADISEFLLGKYIACSYDDRWNIAVVLDCSNENNNVKVKFMKRDRLCVGMIIIMSVGFHINVIVGRGFLTLPFFMSTPPPHFIAYQPLFFNCFTILSIPPYAHSFVSLLPGFDLVIHDSQQGFEFSQLNSFLS